jgi:hypothetical protein
MYGKPEAKTKEPGASIDPVRQGFDAKSSMRDPIVMHLSYPSPSGQAWGRASRLLGGVGRCCSRAGEGVRFWASSMGDRNPGM